MTELEITTAIANLRAWEGSTSWMYRDSADAGNITIGIGCMLPDLAVALKLPFLYVDVDRSPPTAATVAQITTDWNRVMALPPKMAAGKYRAHATLVYLREDDVNVLARKRLTEFVAGLVKRIPGFEELPSNAKLAAVDIAWNTGWSFHSFFYALGKRDWDRAIKESHRKTIAEKNSEKPDPAEHAFQRNAWVASLLETCKRKATA